MAYSKAKLQSNGDKAPPFIKPVLTGNVSDRCLSTRTFWLVVSKSTLMIPCNFLCIWKLPWEEECWIKCVFIWKMWYSYVLSPFLYSGTMVDSFHFSGNFSLFQIEVISLWIWERTVLSPALSSSFGIWWIPCDLYLFRFWIFVWKSKTLGSGCSVSVVCISVCLTLLTPCTFYCWKKWRDKI